MSNSKPFKLRFSEHDRVVINEVAYRFVELTSHGYNFRRNDTDLVETFSREQIETLRREKKFGVDRDFYSIGKARARAESDLQFLTDLPNNKAAEIFRRLDWCHSYLEMEKADPAVTRSDAAMGTAIAKIQATLLAKAGVMPSAEHKKQRTDKVQQIPPAPSPKTLRTWLKRYENSGYDARALCPRHNSSGDRRSKVCAETRHIMKKHVASYMDEKRHSKLKCFDSFLKEIDNINERRHLDGVLPIPKVSKRTFLKEIDQLSAFAVHASRYGLEAAKRKFHMSSGGLEIRRPLERVETDEWHIHLHTLLADFGLIQFLSPREIARLERCRWHLCIVIDCATRCIPGASIAPTASPQNALRALHLTCIDKTKIATDAGAVTPWDMHGTPDCVSSDNGSSFIAVEYRASVSDLGANPDFPPAGFPELRGRVERAFRTIDSKVLSDFVGRSFSNIVELGDYPAEQRASITVEELFDVLIRYFVDQYHNEPHDGLLGETPRNAWLRLTEEYGAPPPPTPNMLRATFGLHLERTIGDHGIRVLGLWYQSEALQEWRRQYGDVKLDIRVDPEDLGCISAKLGKSWVQLAALSEWAPGLSIRTWLGVCEDLRARFGREADVARHAVNSAIRARQALNQKSIDRAGLGPTTLTTEAVERAERDMSLSFRCQSQAASSTADDRDPLHDDTFPVAPIAPPPAAPSAEPSPEKDDPDDKNWRIED